MSSARLEVTEGPVAEVIGMLRRKKSVTDMYV
jgi:hypothetical protein